ncbi:hypothetical protein GCM10027072_74440 [Streptomyces bullii]
MFGAGADGGVVASVALLRDPGQTLARATGVVAAGAAAQLGRLAPQHLQEALRGVGLSGS